MTTLRTGCTSKPACPHYSYSLRRCSLGYVNPKTIGGAINATLLGLIKPCPHTVKGQMVIARIREGYDKTGPEFAEK
jgi:hypothetical protein